MSGEIVASRSTRWSVVGLAGGYLLYDGTELRLLNEPAAAVYDAVNGISDLDSIASSLAADVANGAEIRTQVRQFLQHLAHMGVINVLSAPAEPGYSRPPTVGFAHDGDVSLLIDMQDGRRHMLTSTGSQVWQLACELHHASLVTQTLRGRFADGGATLASDVQALLDELVAHRFLLEWHP